MTVTPYNDSSKGKKEQVRQMFNNISHRYDFLNHLLSMGIDKRWRKKAVRLLEDSKPKQILDIATGTGDFAIECMALNPEKIVGIDISENMLEMGKVKMIKMNLSDKIDMQVGDSENLNFADNTFDGAVVGFGVRNFENLKKGLTEILRVLNTNSKLVVLEFSKPHAFPVKQLYGFYFSKILPTIGGIISKDRRAYSYLNESVEAFPEGQAFLDIMNECGYREVSQIRLMLGIASIYVGKK